MRTYSADCEASEFCGRKLGGIVMINDATGMPCVVPSAAEVLFAESLRCFVNSCVYRRLPGGRQRFGLSALHAGGGRRRQSEARRPIWQKYDQTNFVESANFPSEVPQNVFVFSWM